MARHTGTAAQLHSRVMNEVPLKLSTTTRAKAVWGPKRIVTAAAFVALALGLTADAGAAGRHQRQARRGRPGVPNGFVSRDKMDSEVAKRASGFNLLGLATADVIVTLEDGAKLPGRVPALLAQRRALGHPRLRARSGAGLAAPDPGQKHQRAPRPQQPESAQARRAVVLCRQRQCRRHWQRHQPTEPVQLHRCRCDGRVHRLRHHVLSAPRPHGRPRPRLRRLRQWSDDEVRRQRSRHARRRHPGRHRQALREEVCGHRAGRLAGVAQGPQPERRGFGRQHSQGARLGLQERQVLRRARRESVGRRRGHRVVLHRPADAGDQDAGGPGHHRGGRGRQQRPERRRRSAVGRHRLAGQRAVGPHGLRLQHQRQLQRRGRHCRSLQLVGADRSRLRCQAGPVRAGRRRGFDGGSGQHAVPVGADHHAVVADSGHGREHATRTFRTRA